MSLSQFQREPPPTSWSRLSFPRTHILLVTLARPGSLNCIDQAGHRELELVWQWLDEEPSLRVGIVTGDGRAFCTGADLKEFKSLANASETVATQSSLGPGGFGGLSSRHGLKPIIAAVNGLCFGGGLEMIANCDLVLASVRASFGLPEAKVGVAAIAGALPRLPRTIGRPRAMEMALTGRAYPPETMKDWGLLNAVVADDVEGGLMGETLRWAEEIVRNSPDSVIVSREGILQRWEGDDLRGIDERVTKGWWSKMLGKSNMMEGPRAWAEKRTPKWVNSKL